MAVPRLRIEFVQILSDGLNDMAGNTNPVEIKLFGANLAQLEAYAKQIAPSLGKVPGVADLYDGVAEPDAELSMRVHEAEAARLGAIRSPAVGRHPDPVAGHSRYDAPCLVGFVHGA